MVGELLRTSLLTFNALKVQIDVNEQSCMLSFTTVGVYLIFFGNYRYYSFRLPHRLSAVPSVPVRCVAGVIPHLPRSRGASELPPALGVRSL